MFPFRKARSASKGKCSRKVNRQKQSISKCKSYHQVSVLIDLDEISSSPRFRLLADGDYDHFRWETCYVDYANWKISPRSLHFEYGQTNPTYFSFLPMVRWWFFGFLTQHLFGFGCGSFISKHFRPSLLASIAFWGRFGSSYGLVAVTVCGSFSRWLFGYTIEKHWIQLFCSTRLQRRRRRRRRNWRNCLQIVCRN